MDSESTINQWKQKHANVSEDFQQHKSHCERNIQDLKEEISGLERRLKEKDSEIHRLEEIISSLEKKIRELSEDSSSSSDNEELEDLRKQVKKLKEEVKDTKERAELRIEELLHTIKDFQERLIQKELEIKRLLAVQGSGTTTIVIKNE